MDIYVGMRRRIVLCVLVGCLAVLAACADKTGQNVGGASPAASATSSIPSPTPSAPALGGPRVVPSGSPGVACVGSGTQVALTDADSGANVCLVTGGQLKLTLNGTGWTQPVVSGDALRADPTFAKGAFLFTAAKPGTVTLMSSRPACPSARPGTMTCHAIEAFRISVTVA